MTRLPATPTHVPVTLRMQPSVTVRTRMATPPVDERPTTLSTAPAILATGALSASTARGSPQPRPPTHSEASKPMPAGRSSRPISKPMPGVTHHQPISRTSQLIPMLMVAMRTIKTGFFTSLSLFTERPGDAARLRARGRPVDHWIVLPIPPVGNLVFVPGRGRILVLPAGIGSLGLDAAPIHDDAPAWSVFGRTEQGTVLTERTASDRVQCPLVTTAGAWTIGQLIGSQQRGDGARVQLAPLPAVGIVAQSLAQFRHALLESLKHHHAGAAPGAVGQGKGRVGGIVQRPGFQVLVERGLAGAYGQVGMFGDRDVPGLPPGSEGVEEVTRPEGPPDRGGGRSDIHVLVPACQQPLRLLRGRVQRVRLERLEQLWHDQARQVVVRAVLHALHILHGQLLSAAQFRCDLIGAIAVVEVIPGSADVVGIVVPHRTLIGGEHHVVGGIV